MRGHPWHPVLVHFPIACWTLAALIDAATLAGAGERAAALLPGVAPAALSYTLLWIGVLLGVATMIVGFVDFLRLPSTLQRGAALNWHVIAMLGAWALFLGAALLRPKPTALPAPASLAATLAEIAGLACLGAGGALAAAVVFDGWPRVAAGERRHKASSET
jgi:uncharacterized membrane protein